MLWARGAERQRLLRESEKRCWKRQRGFRLGNVVFLSFPIYNLGVIIVPPS